MKIRLFIVGLSALPIFAACSYDIQKSAPTARAPGNQAQGPIKEPANEPATDPVTDPTTGEELAPGFDIVLRDAITPACFGCHRAPRNAAGLNLETYENVFANREKIAEAVSTQFMPESMGREMSPEARELLLKWIERGAPRDPQPITDTSIDLTAMKLEVQ